MATGIDCMFKVISLFTTNFCRLNVVKAKLGTKVTKRSIGAITDKGLGKVKFIRPKSFVDIILCITSLLLRGKQKQPSEEFHDLHFNPLTGDI